MKILVRLCILSGLLLPGGRLFSQNHIQPRDCYDRFVNDGKSYMSSRDYGRAINQFWAAYECKYEPGNEELRALINQSVRALENAKDEAEKAEQTARTNEKLAIEARAVAVNERIAKEKALEEAYRFGKKAEAMLLSSLSGEALRKGEDEEALWLAFLGLQLSGQEELPEGLGAFGQAVREFHSKSIFKSEVGIFEIEMLGENELLIHTGGGLFLKKNDENPPVKIAAIGHDFIKTAFSPETNILAAATGGNTIQLWDGQGSRLNSFNDHDDEVVFCRYSKNGQLLLSGSRDKTAVIRDLKTSRVIKLLGHEGSVYDARFSPDGTNVLTRSSDGTVRVWDIDGSCLGVIGGREIYIHDAIFDETDGYILTAGANGLVKRWNFKGDQVEELLKHDMPVKEMLFSIETGSVVSRSAEAVKIYREGTAPVSINHTGSIAGMQCNQNGTALLTWSDDGAVKLSDFNGTLLREFKGQDASVLAAFFSKDGQSVLATTESGHVTLWDNTGNLLLDLNIHLSRPVAARFINGGSNILTLEENNSVKICPLPAQVFDEMSRDNSNWNKPVERLREKYKLEFVSDLPGLR